MPEHAEHQSRSRPISTRPPGSLKEWLWIAGVVATTIITALALARSEADDAVAPLDARLDAIQESQREMRKDMREVIRYLRERPTATAGGRERAE